MNTAQASLEARLSDAGHERQELLAQLAARDHWFVFICENRMVQFFSLCTDSGAGRYLRTQVRLGAGIPGQPSTQTGFGALTYTTSPPTGLLGVGLGGDSTPRMIAFQARLEF